MINKDEADSLVSMALQPSDSAFDSQVRSLLAVIQAKINSLHDNQNFKNDASRYEQLQKFESFITVG